MRRIQNYGLGVALVALLLVVFHAPAAARADTAQGDAIVADAQQYLGDPYCWAGGTLTPSPGPSHGSGNSTEWYGGSADSGCNNTGPEASVLGFDCTGLTMVAVYEATGIVLPHSGAQVTAAGGTPVHGLPNAQPGDILFFGSSTSSIVHAGIYVSNNLMINAYDYKNDGDNGPNNEYWGVTETPITWETHAEPLVAIVRFAGGPPPPPPPTAPSLTAVPQVLDGGGDSITLTAAASNATAYTFWSLNPGLSGMGTVSSTSGSATAVATLPPDAALVPQTLTLNVTASGPGGAATSTVYLSLSQVEARIGGGSGTNPSDDCRQTGGQNNVSSYIECTPYDGSAFGPTATSGVVDWGFTGSDVWVPTTKGADYCRQTGGIQNNVNSYIECTPYDGSSFGPTATSGVVDWGFPGSDVWIPTGTGADYCRQTGGQNNVSSYLECTPYDGSGFGPTATSGVVDWGFTGSSVWVPTSSGADYCRQTGGQNNVSSYLECTPYNGTSFGSTATSGLVDWGFTGSDAWIPTTNGADYCRQTGGGQNNVNSYIECTPYDGSGFGPTATSDLVDWGFTGSSVWVPTSSGADYCRQTGGQNNVSSFIECTPYDGTRFGPTATSGVVDWGVAGSDVWIPTGTGADYCRQTGGQNNVSSFIECTPYDGTSFGPTATSGVVDWGFTGSGVWVPTSKGANYCRETGGQNNVSSYLECTPYDGTNFGPTTTSGVVDWGFTGSDAWTGFGSGGGSPAGGTAGSGASGTGGSSSSASNGGSVPATNTSVAECVVPRLHHMKLATARRALLRSHCKLGRVRRQRRRHRHQPLRVSSQSAHPGSRHRQGYAVNVSIA